MSDKRYLILAEGFSHDPHYGKTLRGVMRYRRDSVVAILDSKRAGESETASRSSARSTTRCASSPTPRSSASSRRAAASPATGSELLKSCVAKGLDLENGLHVRLHDDPGLAELAAQHGVELRDLREPPAGT